MRGGEEIPISIGREKEIPISLDVLPIHCNSIGEEEIFKYKDVVLKRSDLNSLRDCCYITDLVIDFYFSFLSSTHPSPDILLVPPTLSFYLANCEDPQDFRASIEPLDLSHKQLVVFTVNDNNAMSGVEGGSHWSLLVYSRALNKFVHHDSLFGVNLVHAKKLYRAVRDHVGGNGDVMGSPSSSSPQHNKRKRVEDDAECVHLRHGSTPQQCNAYDCGLYVMAIAKVICEWYEEGDYNVNWIGALWKNLVDGSMVRTMRKEVSELIKDLSNKD